MSLNLDDFKDALKEAYREQEQREALEAIRRQPWHVTFITRDGCKRETKMQWESELPPEEVKVPFFSSDGRKKEGERCYARNGFDARERVVYYGEAEPKPTPKTDSHRYRQFIDDIEIRHHFFKWDWFEPRLWPTKKPEPVKPLHVQVPTPEEVKRYSFAPDRPPEIIRVDNVHNDWLDPLSYVSPPPYVVPDTFKVPKRDVWGRIPVRLTGITPSLIVKDIV